MVCPYSHLILCSHSNDHVNKSTLTYIGIYIIIIEKIINEWLESDCILLKPPSVRRENIPKRLTKALKFDLIESISLFLCLFFSTISYYVHNKENQFCSVF